MISQNLSELFLHCILVVYHAILFYSGFLFSCHFLNQQDKKRKEVGREVTISPQARLHCHSSDIYLFSQQIEFKVQTPALVIGGHASI